MKNGPETILSSGAIEIILMPDGRPHELRLAGRRCDAGVAIAYLLARIADGLSVSDVTQQMGQVVGQMQSAASAATSQMTEAAQRIAAEIVKAQAHVQAQNQRATVVTPLALQGHLYED